MTREVLGRCPVCGSTTEVTGISCNDCGTKIEGHFQLCRYCRLTDDQKVFIDAFLKCRGNIKEVEKELGISYPTVKNRLEDVAGALGYGPAPEPDAAPQRREILDRLDNGDISVEDAIEMLK